MNEIILYDIINSAIATSFIAKLNEVKDFEQVCVRFYCPGGDVQAAWGMWAKINEIKNKGCIAIAKVDGSAASMGGFLLCAFDEREALEVSSIMIHRAEFSATNEKGETINYTPSDLVQLSIINRDLKARLNAIIDNKKLKKIKGYGIDDLFDESKERINCFLSPEEALEIGLITKIIPMDTANSQNIVKAVAQLYTPKATAASAEKSNSKVMTKDEFKEKSPEAYKAIEDDAVKAYKAKIKEAAKAKASSYDPDDDGDDDGEGGNDPDKDGKGKAKKAKAEMATMIASGIEAAFKKYGIEANSTQAPQTAQATAAQAIQQAKDQATAQETELQLTKELIEATKRGDAKAIAEISQKLYK